ncbi:unnamed protein product, partial [Didymodactylos carnosus]
MDCD